ncbi:MAG TPA: arylsulfotransferase family protein, partial [Thermoanaerobaculia bacterium]|nr:arylsulfotransferase family protein [Thermoanaerobaculia bacterium]
MRQSGGRGSRAAAIAIAIAALAAAAVWGYRMHRDQVFPYRLARWAHDAISPARLPHRFRPGRPDPADAARSREAIDGLARLPYLQGYRARTEGAAVRIHDRAGFQDGLNLYTSGHAPVATLMDMEGRVVRRWTVDPSKAFPGLVLEGDDRERDRFLRVAHLLPDGGVLALVDQIGLVRLDADARVLWATRARLHHDFVLDPRGGAWALLRGKRSAPDLYPRGPIWEDFVAEFAIDGRILCKVSILDAFRRSSYAPLLARVPREADIFHTNSLQVLDGSLESRSPLFRKGNLLLSIHHLDVLAILDPEQGRIVWALSGQWRAQHSARLLGIGHLLLFDNLGSMHAASRALEVDPFTQEILWRYGGAEHEDLLSETNGFVQRLDNGNT